MIHLLKVLYYQYFRFYQRFEKFGEEPHPHARYSIVLNLIALFLPLITFPLTYFFCLELDTWFYVGMLAVIFLLRALFHKKGIDVKIEKEKPKLLGSTKLSIIFTVVFWAGSFIFFYFATEYEKRYYDEHCIEYHNK